MKQLLTFRSAQFFAVGLVILLALGVVVRFSLWKPDKSAPSAEVVSTTLYETRFDSHVLTITSAEKSDERVVTLTISGEQTAPVTLPIEDQWNEITDSKIIPLGGNRYGIILFYSTADCESSTSNYNLDLFSYGNDIQHLETLTATEHYPLDAHKSSFYAMLPVSAPYVEGFNTWDFTIPVVIRIDQEVTLTPLLTREGIALIQQIEAKDRQAILDKLTQGGEKDATKDFLNAEQELNKALAPRTITFL